MEFPQIGELPYLLTLAGHSFYWFRLAKPVDVPQEGMPTEGGAHE